MLVLIMEKDMFNKTFQVINRKTGKPEFVVIRQITGIDKLWKIGDRIPRVGLIIGVKQCN